MPLSASDWAAAMLTDEAYEQWLQEQAPGDLQVRQAPGKPQVRTALYRFFDANDGLLYVGITKSIVPRIHGHSRKPWSWQATRVTLEWFPSEAEARAAELKAIKTEDPAHNIAGK